MTEQEKTIDLIKTLRAELKEAKHGTPEYSKIERSIWRWTQHLVKLEAKKRKPLKL